MIWAFIALRAVFIPRNHPMNFGDMTLELVA